MDPGEIVDNEFRGTVPGTFSHAVFAAHGTHDVFVRGNRARDRGPSGKTWRFLVLSWQGYGDVIERNLIEGLGSAEGDTIPWSNEPEIILTEAYHINYEGTVIDLSERRPADLGPGIRSRFPRGPARLSRSCRGRRPASGGGSSRRSTRPLIWSTARFPPARRLVSISPGFVGEVFQDNRIDMRGGRKSIGLVFVGNHFGTRVVKNHVLGGECAFKLTACPSETPDDVGLDSCALSGRGDRRQTSWKTARAEGSWVSSMTRVTSSRTRVGPT